MKWFYLAVILSWASATCLSAQDTGIAQPPIALIVIAAPVEQGEAEQLVKITSSRDVAALKSWATQLGFTLQEHNGTFFAFSPSSACNVAEAEIDLLRMLWLSGGQLKLSDHPNARPWCDQAISSVYKGSLEYVEKRLQIPNDQWLSHCPVDLRLRAKISAACKIPGVSGIPKIYLEDAAFPLSSEKIPPELLSHQNNPSTGCTPPSASAAQYVVLFSESIPNSIRSERAMSAFQRLHHLHEQAETRWRAAIEALNHLLYERLSLPTSPQTYAQLTPQQQHELRSRLQSMDSMFEAMKQKVPHGKQIEQMEVQFKVVPVVEMQFQCEQGGWSHTIALGETSLMEMRMRWFNLPERK